MLSIPGDVFGTVWIIFSKKLKASFMASADMEEHSSIGGRN